MDAKTNSAKERWTLLDSKRQTALTRARDCSKLTIPALIPPLGHNDNSVLPTPYQSLGARGVNNLASKLLLALLPPGQSCFRLQIAAAVREAMKKTKGALEAAEGRLAEIEMTVSKKIETISARPVLFESLKHLIVAGNVLLHMPDTGLKMFRIDQYVVCRAPNGQPIESIVKETVHPLSLSAAVRAATGVLSDQKEMVDVYTIIEWIGERVHERQEINGKVVPGSQGDRPTAKSEWLPLRWTAVPGQDYGRGLCEEYLGDLISLEGIYQSLVQFAAAASKIVFLVHPASTTNFDDVAKAESGESVQGSKADIDILSMEKYADFQVVKTTADDLTLRLSHAFLLRSGTIRDAERVTAEEIRDTAQELEDVLGGTYTVLANELQLPFVRRQMQQMQQKNELPALPEKVVEPVIVTGFEALGRNHSVNKLRAWVADVTATDPTKGASLHWDKINRRLGIGYGVENLDELIKTPAELEQDRQRQIAATLAEKAAGPVAGAVASASAPK